MFLLFIVFLLGEPLKLMTPRGEVVIDVSEKERDVSVMDIKDNIRVRLEEIQKLLPKPGVEMTHLKRRRRILNLIEQIAGLVEFIPLEGVISIGGRLRKQESIIEGMEDPEFKDLLEKLGKERTPDGMLKTIEVVAKNNRFYVDQVCKILRYFTDEEDRLKALKLLWTSVLDRENGSKILLLFQFEHKKNQAEKVLKED